MPSTNPHKKLINAEHGRTIWWTVGTWQHHPDFSLLLLSDVTAIETIGGPVLHIRPPSHGTEATQQHPAVMVRFLRKSRNG